MFSYSFRSQCGIYRIVGRSTSCFPSVSAKHRIPKLWNSALSASVNTGSYTDTSDGAISKMVHELMRKASCARASRDDEGLPKPRQSTSGHVILVFRRAFWTRPDTNQIPLDSISALQRSTRSISRGDSRLPLPLLLFFRARARVVACEYTNEVSSIAEQDDVEKLLHRLAQMAQVRGSLALIPSVSLHWGLT